MVIYLKNKFVSITDGSFVVDEEGNNLFKINGKLFSPTHKKFLYDQDGNLKYIVRNKYWHFITKKAFIIDAATNKKIAKVKEKFFSPNVLITDCEDDIYCESAGLFKGFNIFKNGTLIGKWGRGAQGVSDVFREDTYRINVENPEDALLISALVLAIDNINDNRRNKK